MSENENGLVTFVEVSIEEIKKGHVIKMGSICMSLVLKKLVDEGHVVVVSHSSNVDSPYLVGIEQAPDIPTMKVTLSESPTKDILFREVTNLSLSLNDNILIVSHGDDTVEEFDMEDICFYDVTVE